MENPLFMLGSVNQDLRILKEGFTMKVKHQLYLLVVGLLLLIGAPLVSAGETQSFTVLVSTQADSVHFSAQAQDAQALRIEILTLNGKKIFDTGLQNERALDWPMSDSQGRAVANGIYLYIATIQTEQGSRRQVGKIVVLHSNPVLSTASVDEMTQVEPLSHNLKHCAWVRDAHGFLFVSPLECRVGIGTNNPLNLARLDVRTAKSTSGTRAIFGYATSTANEEIVGIWGKSDATNGVGVRGEVTSSVLTGNIGVHGLANVGLGVQGETSDGTGVGGFAGGSTGIGVLGHATDGTGDNAGVYARSNSAGGAALKAENTSGNANANVILGCSGFFCSNIVFRVRNNGNVTADGTFTGGGADYADMLTVAGKKSDYEPGDVLVIGPDGKLTKSAQPYSTALAGVYSTQPAFVGDTQGASEQSKAAADNRVPLALVGMVPVKVTAENGAIRPGDLLTTSSLPGYAMRATEPKVGTVLGKALESLESGTGVIKVLITLR